MQIYLECILILEKNVYIKNRIQEKIIKHILPNFLNDAYILE